MSVQHVKWLCALKSGKPQNWTLMRQVEEPPLMYWHAPLQWTRPRCHSPASLPAPRLWSLSRLRQDEAAHRDRKAGSEHSGRPLRSFIWHGEGHHHHSLISSCLWMRPLLRSLKSTWASLYLVITSTNFLDSTACWEKKKGKKTLKTANIWHWQSCCSQLVFTMNHYMISY